MPSGRLPRDGFHGPERTGGKSTPKIPNSLSKIVIQGEKPLNYVNGQSLAARMTSTIMNRRYDNQDLSIYGSSGQVKLVDKLCPWKNGVRSFDSMGQHYSFDSSQCCKTCTAKSFDETLLSNVGELGYCNVLQLPYDYRTWAYRGPLRLYPNFLKYTIFSTTAKRFFYHSITPQVMSNRHITAFMSNKLQPTPRCVRSTEPSLHDFVYGTNEATSIRKLSAERQKLIKFWSSKVMLEYENLRACMTGPIVFLFGWLLLKFFNKIYSKIIIAHAHIERLQQHQKLNENKNLPFVYLPLHKSHIDYLLISMVLWQYGLCWPHIIAGNNLRMPGLGWILSRMGAIFIRRSSAPVAVKSSNRKIGFFRRLLRRKQNLSQPDKDQTTDDTALQIRKESAAKFNCYVTVLKAYIEEILRLGWPLEVFIEGGRSRSGKPISDPKVGIVSTIVESLDANQLTDALIVPVAITYDKVMDMSSFHDEWQGLPKKKETFWGTVKEIIGQLRQRYGTIRVNFGQPFSAKDMIKSLTAREPKIQESTRAEISKPSFTETVDYVASDHQSLPSELSIPDFKSVNSSYNKYLGNREPTSKAVIEKLASHSLFLSQQSSSIMSTHLVAFVLMNIHRSGTSVEKLIQSIGSLMMEIQRGVVYQTVSLGFSGTPSEAFMYFNILFPHLIRLKTDSDDIASLADSQTWESITVAPNFVHSNVVNCFELTYLSNHLACQVSREAILSTVLLMSSEVSMDSMDTVNFNKSVSRSQIIDESSMLAMILAEEFIVCPPCQELEELFDNLIGHFESCGFVHKEKEVDNLMSKSERDRQNRIAAQYEFNAGSSDEESDLFDSSEDELHGEVVIQDKTLSNNSASKVISKEDRLYINFEDREAKMKLTMYASILGPIIESYWFVSLSLNNLLAQDLPYDVFLKQCHAKLKLRYEQKLLRYEESCCFEFVKNALKFLVSFAVLRTYIASNAANYVTLTDYYKDSEKLLQLQDLFVQFKL